MELSRLIATVWVLVPPVYSQNVTDLKTLYTDLFSDYRKEVMPLKHLTLPMDIGVIFFLISFNSFHEVDETVSVTASVSLNWTDPSLTWIPAKYGNIFSAVINPKDLWLPPFSLVNSVDTVSTAIGEGAKFYTLVYANGQVIYSPAGILNAKCPTDISKFPFDEQTCNLSFLPYGITSHLIKLQSILNEARLDSFTSHSDWNLDKYTTSVSVIPFGYHIFKVRLVIQRQPLYYVVMIILPTLIFCLLNPLVFVLPVDSGERVSLAVTFLLSYAVFLTLVAASIPKSSNPMCGLVVLMVIMISISGFILLGSVLSSKYFHLPDEGKMSFCLIRLTKKWTQSKNQVNNINKEVIVSGKDVADVIDSLFFYGTYASIILSFCTYFAYVLM